ncbi:MAG: FAD-dependent oxidoreductase [Betaproteobacteria bacterium]
MRVEKSGNKKRVVIVGGGHAGFRAAKRLLDLRKPSDDLEVVVASRETSEVYHGLMPQIVGGKIQARNILVPLRNYLPGIVFYNYEVESIDLENRKVYLDPVAERAKIEIPYDYLVLALGSVTDLSRFPGLQEHGLQTKTIGDVYHLHDHLLEMLERASVEEDATERQRLLTFVVAGAGYAGIEIGAEANDLLRSASRAYPNIGAEELRVSIVCSTNRILPHMHDKLAQSAATHLAKRGVALHLNTRLLSASAGEVILSNGERVQSRTIIVTVGIAPNPVVASLPVQKDGGRVKTDEFCRVPGLDGVYAVGDNAAIPHYKSGTPCPATFLYAFTQGIRAGENIIAELRGKPLRQYTFRSFGEVAQLGNTFGLVQLFGVPFSGFLASLLVRMAFFVAVPSWRCRLGLMADWISAIALPTDLTQMRLARTDMIVHLRFSAGQEIIRQGDPGSRFYIVSTGKVEVVRRTETHEQVLATLGPGEYFGEIALLHASARTATVRAVEDTTVLGIARIAFSEVVHGLPVLGQAMSEIPRNALAFTAPEES